MSIKDMSDFESEEEAKEYFTLNGKREIAFKYFNKLRLDLAVREDNFHPGSKLGGNPSEFWFIANHKFKVYLSSDDKPFFTNSGPNEITAHLPGIKGFQLSEIRKAFTEFYNQQSDKISISSEEIHNLDYVKSLKINHMNAFTYVKALEVAHELVYWLDSKIDLMKKISSSFDQEISFLKKNFLKEMNLPETYFSDLEKEKRAKEEIGADYYDQNSEDDPLGSMFKKHPVWGARRDASLAREKLMISNLLSQEDKDRMNFIGSCPYFIAMQASRFIGIERMVHLNLDEVWDLLGKVSKELEKEI